MVDKIAADLAKLDQSGGKTAGLNHVTKDMKSSANKDAPPVAPKSAPAAKVVEAPKKQVFALQGQKWVVEGQITPQIIKADHVTVKHTV